MRLALVHHQFLTRGGLEGYLCELLHQFRAAGHEVELLGSKIDANFREAASAVHTIPAPLFGRGRLVRKFAEKSAAYLPQLSVDATLGFGRTWRQDIHRAGGGCHAVYSRLLPWHKRLAPKNQLELEIEQKLYTSGQTPRFVVNAPMVAQEIQENYGVAADRISVIPTGVDTAHWLPAANSTTRQALREKLHPGLGQEAVLLFVSLDHGRKGLETLLHALARLPDHTVLWIVGQGLSQDYMKKIHRLGLAPRVKSFGRQADLRPYYQAADLFVHPTQYDACANTVLQSMACGLPGLISVNDGGHFHIQDAGNGFLLRTPHLPEALQATILQALAADLPALARSARATMLPITWSSHVTAWLSLIGEMRS